MAKRDSHRWWDWRVSQVSGRSIRTDDKRGPGAPEKTVKKKGRSGGGWWWTMIGREAQCDGCKAELQPPRKVAYNHNSRKVYCPECAKAQCVSTMCRPSKKLRSDSGGEAVAERT